MVHTTRRRREKENESSGVHLDLRGIAAGAGATNSVTGGVDSVIENVTIGGKPYEGDDTKKGGDTETVARKDFHELEERVVKGEKRSDSQYAIAMDTLGNLAKKTKESYVDKGTYEGLMERFTDFGVIWHNKMGEIDGKFGALEKDSAAYRKEFSGVKSELIAQLDEIKNLKGLTKEHKKRIDTLEKDIGGKSTVEELKNLESMVNREIDYTIKESKRYTDAEIKFLEPVFKNIGGCISDLDTRVKDLAEDTKNNLETYLGRLELVEGLSKSDAEEIEKINEVLKRDHITRDDLRDVENRMRSLSEEAVKKSKDYTDHIEQELNSKFRDELDGYKTKVDELGENVAGFGDKLLEIKDGLIGMVDDLSNKTGGQYESLRKVVDGLSGENADKVIETVKNYMGAMEGDIESLKKSPTYIQDTVSEGVIDREMTKKYQGKHGLGENLTVGGLLDKAGEAENRDEKERLEQIAYAAGAKRCKQLGISYNVLGRSIKHAGDTKDPTYKKEVMRGVKTFLEMEKNADRYQSVLNDILEKGTPTKNEKKTLQKMNGALSFVGMGVKPEYATNGKPTEGYIKELSSKLKEFKELMK